MIPQGNRRNEIKAAKGAKNRKAISAFFALFASLRPLRIPIRVAQPLAVAGVSEPRLVLQATHFCQEFAFAPHGGPPGCGSASGSEGSGRFFAYEPDSPTRETETAGPIY